MGDLSKHFSRHEFKCKCGNCDYETIDYETLDLLEKIREHFKNPVKINSAHRCPEHNFFVGSNDTSQHIRGKACDIVVKNTSLDDVYDFVNKLMPDKGGIGIYEKFIHIDTRAKKSRWDSR